MNNFYLFIASPPREWKKRLLLFMYTSSMYVKQSMAETNALT